MDKSELDKCFSFSAASFPNLRKVGLDGAGKTTITYQLAFGVAPMATPTLGSNVEQVRYFILASFAPYL